jgi:hypothetical protein
MGHAALLHILLGAQRIQREARWTAEAATARETNGGRDYSPHKNSTGSEGFISITAVRECVDRVIASWETWMSEMEKWKADVASLEGEFFTLLYVRIDLDHEYSCRLVLFDCLSHGLDSDLLPHKSSPRFLGLGARIQREHFRG